MPNPSLGRGLGSLISSKKDQAAPPSAPAAGISGQDQVHRLAIAKIRPSHSQPRTSFDEQGLSDLAASIKEHGIIQPLVVSRSGDGYELIAGERRLRAAKLSGLDKVPAIIRQAGEQERLELALIENIQRENLNPIELARAYKRLAEEFSLSQEEIGKQVGKSRPAVANTMRLLSLPDEIQSALVQEKISEGHARYLLGLSDVDKQMLMYRKIIHNNLTVNDTDQAIKLMGGTKQARVKINYKDKDKEFAFREFFGAKVEIKRKGKGGQVIINFYSDEELAGLTEKLK